MKAIRFIKRRNGIILAVLVAIAVYFVLYRPDQIVDPRFNSVAIKAAVATKPVAATSVKTTTPASITPGLPTKPKTTTPVSSPAPAQSTPTSSADQSCAPNATSQDPCKLGQCFGYPYGVCESNPNQGSITKDPTPPDPNRPYYDLWGNEFDYQGNLIQASTECIDPISGAVNTYNPSCQQ